MMKRFLKKILGGKLKTLNAVNLMLHQYRRPLFAKVGEQVQVGMPIICTRPQNVILEDYTRINPGAKFITYTGKIIMKKYSEIAYGCTIVTGNHTPMVGIPQYKLGHSHINDKEEDVTIEEDCWIGANVTILKGVTIGRGCVIGAGALVNKSLPPYAVAVGVPAHIIASKFSIEQILEHEKKLYHVEERMKEENLKILFEEYYNGKKSIGVY